jgi:hypothetical protein
MVFSHLGFHIKLLCTVHMWLYFYDMLASEVTPGLQQEQSPTPISLCHDLFVKGDQMEEKSEPYHSNSENWAGTSRDMRGLDLT